jgi:hypothetical protein
MQVLRRLGWKAMAALAVIALITGAPGCGSDDESGGNAKAEQPVQDIGAAQSGKNLSPEEQALTDTYKRFTDRFYAGDGEGACELLTPRAREAFAKARKATCASAFSAVSKALDPQKPHITDFRIKGARALTGVGVAKTSTNKLPWRKTDGQWQIDGGF